VTSLLADPVTRQVQAALADYDAANRDGSWLDEFWRDRYLGRRDRIALNANFFFLFNDADLTGAADPQIARAVRLITAALAYKHGLDTETIPPITRRGTPLSMDQHKHLFSTTRIPGPRRDTVRTPYTDEWPGPSEAKHIIVFTRGNMFAVDVIGPDGQARTPGELARALRAVAAAGAARGRGQGVGALTTKARAHWARSRAALLAGSPENQAALDVVETALFCLALEVEPPADTQDKCKRLLAGDPGSRWFDKGITFIVFPDGSAGFNGEHCELDGTTITEFIDAVLTFPDSGSTAGAATPSWRPVEFALTGDLVADIEMAAKDFTRYDEDTATRALEFPGVGTDTVKRLKISPDAFFQLAFQLAHRRSKGFTGATYESIATRTFKRGRTEAMRVVTPEIVDFVTAMDDPEARRGGDGDAARTRALRAAADAHVARAKQCQAGDAPEQHLWELRLLARRRGIAWAPALYESPGWLISRDDYLSTSAAPSVHIGYFGFGATSEHCVGVAYIPLPDRFTVHLSTPRSVGARMTDFADQLERALSEMLSLLGGQ
jgi:carnitine O-acetyltransferase